MTSYSVNEIRIKWDILLQGLFWAALRYDYKPSFTAEALRAELLIMHVLYRSF